MDVAFILHVNVQDVSTLADEAADIQDDLTSAGHDVVSVTPWTRPTLQSQTGTSTTLPFSQPSVPLPLPPTDPPIQIS